MELPSPVPASRPCCPCPKRDTERDTGRDIERDGHRGCSQQPSIFMRLQRIQAFKYSSGR